MIPGMVGSGQAQLQTTLAAASASSNNCVQPHHPITCVGALAYDENCIFSCEHAVAPVDDLRTQQCVTHSVALLLIELAMQL